MEEKSTDVMQAYETLAIVVSRALGGEEEETSQPAPQTADALEAALARTLG